VTSIPREFLEATTSSFPGRPAYAQRQAFMVAGIRLVRITPQIVLTEANPDHPIPVRENLAKGRSGK